MSTPTIKATVKPSSKGKTMVVIALYALLTLFSVAMAIFDFISGQILFAILFVMSATIFVILLLIKGNAVFGTSIILENDELKLKCWANDFLPYDVNGGIFSDMKPAKTKVTVVPVEDIAIALVGTKDFIKRNSTEAGKRFMKAIFPYEHSSNKSKKNMLTGLDLLYVETADDCAFMCIHDYDPEEVTAILKGLYDTNPNISIKVNSREYKRHIVKLQKAED